MKQERRISRAKDARRRMGRRSIIGMHGLSGASAKLLDGRVREGEALPKTLSPAMSVAAERSA
jgi:hypothetical protein